MLTPDEIARYRELDKKATPGPWVAVQLKPDGTIITKLAYEIQTRDYDVVAHAPHMAPIRKMEDAELIAEVRNAFPGLLDTIEALQKHIHEEGVATGAHIEQLEAKNDVLTRRVERLLELYRKVGGCRLCPMANGCETGECEATMQVWLEREVPE